MFITALAGIRVKRRCGLVCVLQTGFARADPLATLVLAALMAARCALIRESGRMILEAAPASWMRTRSPAMGSRSSVLEIFALQYPGRHLRVPGLSAHVLIEPAADCPTSRPKRTRALFAAGYLARLLWTVSNRELTFR